MIGSDLEVTLSIAIGLSSTAMGLWVLSKGPFLKSNQGFMLIAMVSALVSVTTTAVLLSSDDRMALWALRVDTFLITVFFGTLLYLVLMQPHRRLMLKGRFRPVFEILSRPRVLATIVAVTAVVPAAFVTVSDGPETHIDSAMLPLSVVLSMYLVAILSLLLIALMESDDRKTRIQFLVMSVASLSPFIIPLSLILFISNIVTFGQWLLPEGCWSLWRCSW